MKIAPSFECEFLNLLPSLDLFLLFLDRVIPLLILTIDLDKYFCSLEGFRMFLTFQNKNKALQSISGEGGPLKNIMT